MRVFKNGVETLLYKENSLTFNDDVSKRSTGSITFLKKDGFTVKSGERIDIFGEDGDHVFGGYMKRPRLFSPYGFGPQEIQVELVDNTDIAQRHRVAETYINQLDYVIVKDIYEKYLKQDGIKLGVIASNSGDTTTETKTDVLTTGILSGVEVDAGGVMTLERIDDNPPLSSIFEDFEDATYNFSFNGTWGRTGSQKYAGTYGFKSQSIGHRESSISSFNVNVREGAIGKLSLFYWVSSEANEDFFIIWLKDSQGQYTKLMQASGVDEKWRYFLTYLPPGNYEIELEYDKDKTGSHGQDRAVVDNVTFEEWEGLVYAPSGERTAPKITSLQDAIKSVKIEYDGELPTGTSVDFYYSFDGKQTWELAVDNYIRRSVNGAVGVDVKVVLKTDDTTKTPSIRAIRYILETAAGTAITKAVFSYVPASQALDELCELSGAIWWITPEKVLHYVAMDEFKSPWDLTDGHFPIRNIGVETDLSEYRNRQYLRAGQDVTDLQTENMKGDGSKRTFPVGYKIAQRPDVLLNGAPQTVGIRQVDKNKAFYWVKGEKEITQSETATPLLSTDVLTVKYYGYYPIIVVLEDAAAIAEMQALTGDSGIYEYVDDAPTIDDGDLALEFANSKLRKYAKINTRLTFDTQKPGLKGGQLIEVDMPEHETVGQFLIKSVKIKADVNNHVFYSVECVDGEDVGGWENFFKQLARSSKTYVIRENEVLVRLATQLESMGFGEEMNYTTYACRFPSPTLYPSTNFYPC